MTFKAFKHVNYYLYAERSYYESTAINLCHYVAYVSYTAIFVIMFAKFDLFIGKTRRERATEKIN